MQCIAAWVLTLMKTTLIATQLFDGHQIRFDQPITFDDGRVHSLDTVSGAKEIRVNGLLAPGFIDCQVNGGGGALFNQQPTVGTLKAMMHAHAQFGTTSLLPTVISSDLGLAITAADAVTSARESIPGILGIHFEGPHLNDIRKGIHNQQVLRPMLASELALYQRQDLGQVLVTIAPEVVSASSIEALTAKGVVVSLGHTNATYQQARQALAAGATGFTHLFNAMSQLGSREPGVVGAAFADEESWCGLIADGHHVHPASARIALKQKTRGKVFLVTDAMWTPGSKEKSFQFETHQIALHGDKLLSHTGQLAGAAISMIDAVNNCITLFQLDVSEALRMASLYPAQFLGQQNVMGAFFEGAYADCVLLSLPEHGALTVKNTWLRGQSLAINY